MSACAQRERQASLPATSNIPARLSPPKTSSGRPGVVDCQCRRRGEPSATASGDTPGTPQRHLPHVRKEASQSRCSPEHEHAPAHRVVDCRWRAALGRPAGGMSWDQRQRRGQRPAISTSGRRRSNHQHGHRIQPSACRRIINGCMCFARAGPHPRPLATNRGSPNRDQSRCRRSIPHPVRSWPPKMSIRSVAES